MADIIFTDNGLDFTGKTPDENALGGAEKALIFLAEGLAERGHSVRVYNSCSSPVQHKGVRWMSLSADIPERCDVYIANRSNHLISLVPKAGRAFFWIHNPASYLLKWRYLYPLWKRKPDIIFSGNYHMSTYPKWAPGGNRIAIPLIIEDIFQPGQDAGIPEPVAISTSNPMRGLDWLIDLWIGQVHPALPGARLKVFAGKEVYGKIGDKIAMRINNILERARTTEAHGILVHAPLSQDMLIKELQQTRVMPYRGDPSETFCFALAEAQAVGVPCVVQDIGCVSERIIDGKTGFVARDDREFANKLISLLSDDRLWLSQHEACLARRAANNRNTTLDRYCNALGLQEPQS